MEPVDCRRMVLQVHLMKELFVAEVTSTIVQMLVPEMPQESFVLGVLLGLPMIGLLGVSVTFCILDFKRSYKKRGHYDCVQ
jgi:hypothetical protein